MNILDVANETEVFFNYGAMHGGENGWIVGRETNRWGSHLIAMTENGKIKTIERFADMPTKIGAHLA